MAGQAIAVLQKYLPIKCLFDSLQHARLPSKSCLLPLLSKLLGYAIIVGSTIIKLPQIVIILNHQSTQGLSTVSFETETLGFLVAFSYCIFKGLAFTTYGELFFMLVQDIAIVLLCYYYAPKQRGRVWLKTGVFAATASVLLSGKLGKAAFEVLYAGQHAIFLGARIPQIMENYKNKSTGQLSAVSSVIMWAGTFARLFTSLQDKAPALMVAGCVMGILTHGIIVSQIVLYWPRPRKIKKEE